MRKTTIKRGLGVLLSLMMLLGMVPLTASAAPTVNSWIDLQNAGTTSGTTLTLTGDITIGSGMTIDVEAGWRVTGDATISVSGTANAFVLNSGSVLDGLVITKSDSDNQHIVQIIAANAKVLNCTFNGTYVLGGSQITRAVCTNAGVTGFEISGNKISGLRQPGYIEGTGTISGNSVTGTRGWVICSDYLVSMENNTFSNNAVDIAIIPNSGPNVYTKDIVETMSIENNGAFVEEQNNKIRYKAGNLYAYNADSLIDVVKAANAGDTITLDAGTYEISEMIIIEKPLTIIGIGNVVIQPSTTPWKDYSNGNPYKNLISILSTNSVTLDNLVFQNSLHSGINIFDSTDVTIKNVVSMNNNALGVSVNGSDVKFENVSTSGNKWGGVNLGQGRDALNNLVGAPTITVVGGSYTSSNELVGIYDDTKGTNNSTFIGKVVGAGWSAKEENGVNVWTYTAPPPLPPVTVVTTTTTDDTTIDDEDIALTDLSSYAEELYTLGLFKGVGEDADGNPIFALETPLTRVQALICTIRLLGLEDEALAFEGECPFTDVPAWAAPYVAFGYDLGITNGISETAYAPDAQVTCHQFTAYLLRALGYSDIDGEFEYEDAIDVAFEVELYDDALFEMIDNAPYLRGDAAAAMAHALLTVIDDEEDVLLIDKLVELGLFDQEVADAFVDAIAGIDAILLGGGAVSEDPPAAEDDDAE